MIPWSRSFQPQEFGARLPGDQPQAFKGQFTLLEAQGHLNLPTGLQAKTTAQASAPERIGW